MNSGERQGRPDRIDVAIIENPREIREGLGMLIDGAPGLRRIARYWSRRMSFRLVVVMLLVIPVGGVATAKPDFSQSTITFEPAAPLEGDLVTMVLTLRNSGEEAAPHADVDVTLPLAALFVDVAGVDGARVDLQGRYVQWSGALDASSTRRASIRLIVPRDAGGETLASTMSVKYLFTGSAAVIHGDAQIDTRPAAGGMPLGRIRLGPPEVIIVTLLAAGVVMYLLVRARAPRERSPLRPVAAIVIAVGFWTMFAAMARHDWRALHEYRETQCTILDSRVRFETPGAARPGDAGVGGRQTATASPLLALRYQADGRERISTGFDTGSHLRIGGALRAAAAAMNEWREGTIVPCWYDPVDPQQVVVRRGFGGAYLFALFPLPVFLLGIWFLRAAPRDR